MANDISGNPWIIDTVNGAPLPFLSRVFVKHMEYAGYAVQGNTCIVTDRNGRQIWLATGAFDLEEVRSGDFGVAVNGLNCTQLDGGGILRVYIK